MTRRVKRLMCNVERSSANVEFFKKRAISIKTIRYFVVALYKIGNRDYSIYLRTVSFEP